MYYVYVIKNENNKIYIGQTSNLIQRLERHNGILKSKINLYTRKNGGKWEMIYKEVCETRKEAIQREKELKSYQGRLFIKNL